MTRLRVAALIVGLCALPAAAFDLFETVATVPKAALFPGWHASATQVWGETRVAITTSVPNQFDAAVTLPPNARLRVGIAMLDRFLGNDVLPTTEPTRFTVDFKLPDGTVERLAERVLDPRANPADRRWVDLDVDLGRLAGREGVLQFQDTVAADAKGVNKTSALWSRPVLYDAAAAGTLPNLLFITIDALRADHVGAYGHARDTTPHLDRLAREGVRFAHAYTSAPMTVPSLPQFFTSRVFPSPRTPTLQSSLMQGGVADSKAIVHNPYLEGWLRLYARDGFASVTSGNWRADKITRAALRWIDAHRDRRFALYLHYLDTHTPYMIRGEAALRFADPSHRGEVGRRFDDTATAAAGGFDAGDRAQVEALYDGAIRFVDEQIGILLAGLAERGLLDQTFVVVSADHGEELWDHGGFFHGQSLYDELLHVPLIMRFPGGAHAGTVHPTMVRSIDVLPTIAEVLQLPSFPEFEGRSLVPLAAGAIDAPPSLHARAANPRFPYRFAVRTPAHKLIATVETGTLELYDLAADPGEHHDRIDDPALGAVRAALVAELDAMRAPLRALGYQVRAVSADGRPHAIEVTVTSRAGSGVADNPDRVDLAAGDRLVSSEADRTLRWTGTVGERPAGFRFDQGMQQDGGNDPGLTFDVRVDGGEIAPSAVRLGAAGTSPAAMPFTYRRTAKDVFSEPVEDPPLLASAAPAPAPVAGESVTVWIWRFPGSAAGGTAAAAPVDPETTRRLRALGYAD